eukprot:TRINITY_DN5685_c0_g1_i1.p1 TRINITY_DN5685_c0_g1~~TRINITY_DN5685_c0_g1_i1.p1  ORF type:complete len:185 (-),score=8.49 TRINITY_DN5685_c0_g1_i1:8-562(-)
MSDKYIDKEVLTRVVLSSEVVVIGTDTYSEAELERNILSKDYNALFAVALQFSIVGMGNKTFGQVSIDGEVKKVIDICTANGVITNAQQDAKLQPGDLTIKRLSRFFRYHIADHISNKEITSFLYRKYAPEDTDPQYIFPGAEYMVEGEHCGDLLATYANVDKRLNTNFVERVKQIYKSRGLSG